MNIIKGSKKGKTTGLFTKDNYKSAFAEAWKAALKKENFETVCIFLNYLKNTLCILMKFKFIIFNID